MGIFTADGDSTKYEKLNYQLFYSMSFQIIYLESNHRHLHFVWLIMGPIGFGLELEIMISRVSLDCSAVS